MKVKCKICGSKIERDSAYKIVKEQKSKRVNLYYCSEEEYDKQQDEIIQRDKCYEVIKDILNIPLVTPGMIKQLKTVREYYEYVVITKTFKTKEEDIRWAVNNKEFSNEYNKFRYVLAIILNNIEDIKKVHMKELEEISRLFNKVENNEINIDIMNDMPISTKRKSNDISQFLD
ncbi:Uncharacterised protein [[Clostridium] sordellii]|uniref:hypothetical protein n=1 Tax=Paraclostridium sordellii TaxID=1505 RepID=UPI0005E7E5FC|nr:hypothetical protein [Paeniclostridium sordellii]CEQ01634.1 Uncharacterised protein [[Clostridium] sordellii] [Paeniclostridium sordellii]